MGTIPPFEGRDSSNAQSGGAQFPDGLPPQDAPTVPDVPYPYGQSFAGGATGGFGPSGEGNAYRPDGTPPWPGSEYDAPINYGKVVPKRMPRNRAAGMASRAKRWIIGMSAVGFLALAGLAAGNAVGVSAQSNSSATNSGSSSNGITQPSSGSSVGEHHDDGENDENDNGFFGGNDGGANFGPSNAQPPIGGSSVS